jgi:hypothetical protein
VGRAAEVKYKAPGRVIVHLFFLLPDRYCHCVLVRVCGTTFHFVVSLPLDFLAILRYTSLYFAGRIYLIASTAGRSTFFLRSHSLETLEQNSINHISNNDESDSLILDIQGTFTRTSGLHSKHSN